MRKTVNYPGGTARGLERDDVAVAAKSGTAEIGAGNAYVNSWAAGFWPYEEPRYAFILMMDKAPRSNALWSRSYYGWGDAVDGRESTGISDRDQYFAPDGRIVHI
jgi:cell division protein FtsI/penicillin-binding protein 2